MPQIGSHFAGDPKKSNNSGNGIIDNKSTNQINSSMNEQNDSKRTVC
jgi:hypothetical protein